MIYFAYQSLLYCGLLFFTARQLKSQNKSFRIGWNISLIIMVAGFAGARLFHVFYEYPELYRQDPLRILRFWEGGFVFFGGFFAALAGAVLYLKVLKEDVLSWADFFAPIVSVGYALGRIGCLLAGCCYGSFCDAPWAIQNRHPAPLYATIMELTLFFYLVKLQKTKAAPPGQIFSLWLIGHGCGRIVMESFRSDFRGFFFLGFSISTWISLGLIAAGLVLRSRAQRNLSAGNL